MKTLEKVMGLAALLGLLMKFCFVPFGVIVLLLSLMTLACLYFFLGIVFFNSFTIHELSSNDAFKNISVVRKIESVCLGIFLSLLSIGILFKLQHWRLSELYLKVGITGLLVVVLSGGIGYIKSRDPYYRRIFLRVILFMLIGIPMVLTSDLALLKFQYRNHPDYINAYIECSSNPTNIELQKRFRKEHDRIYMSEKVFKEKYHEAKE